LYFQDTPDSKEPQTTTSLCNTIADMDILEANFPGLLSRSAPQPNIYHPVSPVSSLSDEVPMSRDNFARPIEGM